MKPLVKSRLVWVLAAVVAAQLALYLRRYLPAEQAALLSDELVATLCAALGIGGIGLRVQDKRRARTAGEIVARKIVPGAELAHPRCNGLMGDHRCTRPEGHDGDHSKAPKFGRR